MMLSLQTLDSNSALLCLEIENFCLRQLDVRTNSTFTLAFSGGADSTALTIIFYILAQRLNFKLYAMHVNHGLREEAEEDAKFVENICKMLEIPCKVTNIDTRKISQEKKCGFEEAGRIGRYEQLKAFAADINADYILLGHHAHDLSEDILMRMIRGAGWPALGGMKAKEGLFLRPLLYTKPERLKQLLTSLHIDWCEDASNKSLTFRRNRVRHCCLPFLHFENPSFDQSMINLHSLAEMDEEFWEEHLSNALQKIPWLADDDSILLPAALLAGLHPAARQRLYYKAIKYIKSRLSYLRGQPRCQTLLKLDQAFDAKQNGKQFQLFGNLSAYTTKNGICFATKN